MKTKTELHDDSCVKHLTELFESVRACTMRIVQPLEIEDYIVQTAPFMSPPRWHIGHTSWFFELLLKDYLPGYKIHSEEYLFYFNSYYERFGSRIARDKRGTRSRPTVKETLAYRKSIDNAMLTLLGGIGRDGSAAELLPLVRLGLEHEMQHQELLVYDIKHLLCDLYEAPMIGSPTRRYKVTGMVEIEGGMFNLGYSGDSFAYDNEKPAHPVYIQDFAIDRTPVTNGEYLEFIKSGGYQDFRWWFAQAWDFIGAENCCAPMYWQLRDNEWMIRDFTGLHRAEEKGDEPVSHVSFYEASAYAKWAGKRLPTEAEWERAATLDSNRCGKRSLPWGEGEPAAAHANLLENQLWGVSPVGSFPDGGSVNGCYQLIGDVWEWTSSDYVPYPGFKPDFDEYNDKWFVGQKVLRGGSFATPRRHIRSSYRNFFHPEERWLISGFRCAASDE